MSNQKPHPESTSIRVDVTDNLDDYPSGKLKDVIETLGRVYQTIPIEYRDEAYIDYDYSEYYGSSKQVYYYRWETPGEVNVRKAIALEKEKIAREKAYQEYLKLKKIFEP